MSALIETRDMHGRDVRLTERTWEVHVLMERPWMSEWLHLVELAIMQPTYIFRDKEFADRECFYLGGRRELEGDFLKVVIRYNEDQQGTVRTAYAQQDHTAGEVQLWPR